MRIKSIIGSSIGNVLEWYDFGLFAIYSPLFAHLFFPSDDPHVALLIIFSVFAVGFLCRPIGALIFGYLGDRYGRVKTLRLSILMISIPTLLIGALPTYASVGLWAPILLIVIRIWQGLSLGGEYSGNLIYLAETAPNKHRGVITSLAGTGANIGILLAALVTTTMTHSLSNPAFEQWGWRVPYVVSGIICILVYMTRLQMDETDVFRYLKEKHQLSRNPIYFVFKKNIPQMLRTAALLCMGSAFYYLCFIYMPSFMMQYLHYSLAQATNVITFLIGSMIILVPLTGMLSDHFGRRKMLLFNATFIALMTIPAFYFLLHHQYVTTLFILCLFTIASSLEQSTTSIAVVENYPVPARYTGLSFGYNIGAGIFGGTTPLICEWLIHKTHQPMVPAFYIVLCALVTGFVVYFFVPETLYKSLK